MPDTVRLLNSSSDELNVGGVSYKPDASGAFNVPRDVAAIVVRQPGGFYRGPDVAPPPAAKLPFSSASLAESPSPMTRTAGSQCSNLPTRQGLGSMRFRSSTAPANERFFRPPNAALCPASIASGSTPRSKNLHRV